MKKIVIVQLEAENRQHFETFLKDYGMKIISGPKPKAAFIFEATFPEKDDFHCFLGTAVSKFKELQFDFYDVEPEEEK